MSAVLGNERVAARNQDEEVSMLVKIKAGIASLRKFLRRREVQAWLPNRKVLAGAVGAGLALALREVGLLDAVPAGYLEAVAYAVVAYFVPEYDPDQLGYDEIAFEPDFEITDVPPFSDTQLSFEPDVELDDTTLRSRDDGPGVV